MFQWCGNIGGEKRIEKIFMKKAVPFNIERFRIKHGPRASDETYGMNGDFRIPYADIILNVIISDGGGWDHVSVSFPNRCPTWEEMHWIKRIFWEDDETVIQFHPKESEYINCHPHCLHLWKPQKKEVKLPPWWMIGFK